MPTSTYCMTRWPWPLYSPSSPWTLPYRCPRPGTAWWGDLDLYTHQANHGRCLIDANIQVLHDKVTLTFILTKPTTDAALQMPTSRYCMIRWPWPYTHQTHHVCCLTDAYIQVLHDEVTLTFILTKPTTDAALQMPLSRYCMISLSSPECDLCSSSKMRWPWPLYSPSQPRTLPYRCPRPGTAW